MPNIGKNIKDLRKAWGLTQNELGEAISVEYNTISTYENGRTPKIEILQDIASYLNVSLNELIHGDFSGACYKLTPWTTQLLFNNVEKILPIICSDSAMTDSHFCEAYHQTLRFVKTVREMKGPVLQSSLATALKEYQLSLSKHHTVESAANILWIIFYKFLMILDNHSLDVAQAVMNGKGKDKDFAKKYLLDAAPIDTQTAERKRAYATKHHEVITKMIRILKKSPNYWELGDYYIALKHIYGLVNEQEVFDSTPNVGYTLMFTWLELDNDYAFEFFDAVFSLFQLHDS